jgi:hypothetical protein
LPTATAPAATAAASVAGDEVVAAVVVVVGVVDVLLLVAAVVEAVDDDDDDFLADDVSDRTGASMSRSVISSLPATPAGNTMVREPSLVVVDGDGADAIYPMQLHITIG